MPRKCVDLIASCLTVACDDTDLHLCSQPAQQLAATINEKYPERAVAIKIDVSNEEQVASAVKETVERFGRIDYAINSAGLVVAGDAVELIKDTPTSDYERTQSVDAKGIFLCMKYQIRQMLAQEIPDYPRASRGVIVNLASRASLEGVVSIFIIGPRYLLI